MIRLSPVLTVREQVAAYLKDKHGVVLCEECLGRALHIHRASVHRAAVKVARSGGFFREHRSCSQCGQSRLAVGAAD